MYMMTALRVRRRAVIMYILKILSSCQSSSVLCPPAHGTASPPMCSAPMDVAISRHSASVTTKDESSR